MSRAVITWIGGPVLRARMTGPFTVYEAVSVGPRRLLGEVVQLKGEELHWARKSLEQNFAEVDRADEDTLNRIIWHSVKGVNTPYPVQLAGAHGRGLRKLGLRLDGMKLDDDD